MDLPKFGCRAALVTTQPLYRSCPTAPPNGIQRTPRYQHCYICALGGDAGQHFQICTPIFVQFQNLHSIESNTKGLPQRVPKYDQQTHSKVFQPKSCLSKGLHETPSTWHQEYKPQASPDHTLACPNHNNHSTIASSLNAAPCFTSLPRGTYDA